MCDSGQNNTPEWKTPLHPQQQPPLQPQPQQPHPQQALLLTPTEETKESKETQTSKLLTPVTFPWLKENNHSNKSTPVRCTPRDKAVNRLQVLRRHQVCAPYFENVLERWGFPKSK